MRGVGVAHEHDERRPLAARAADDDVEGDDEVVVELRAAVDEVERERVGQVEQRGRDRERAGVERGPRCCRGWWRVGGFAYGEGGELGVGGGEAVAVAVEGADVSRVRGEVSRTRI